MNKKTLERRGEVFPFVRDKLCFQEFRNILSYLSTRVKEKINDASYLEKEARRGGGGG